MRSERIGRRPLAIGVVVYVVLAVVLPGLFGDTLSVTRYETVLMYLLLAIGLNISFGYAGQLAIAQPAVMGLSAYVAGLLSAKENLDAWATLLPAVAAAVVVNLVLTAPSLRVRGWYMAVITFFAVSVFPDLVTAYAKLTGGDDGLAGIRPFWLSSAGGPSIPQYELILGITALVWLAMVSVAGARLGALARGLRDSPNSILSCGTDLDRLKAMVAVVAAVPVGISGWMFAHVNEFVAPNSFSLNLLLIVVGGVILGGKGTALGPVIGIAIFEGVSLWIGPFSVYNQIILGACVLVVAALFPEGIVPLVGPWLAGRGRPDHPAGRALERSPLAAVPPTGAPAGGVLLRVEGVTKQFGGIKALDGVDLELSAGVVHGLVGPNGSGKTTLLNMVTGFVRPDEGQVWLEGRVLSGMTPNEIARQGVRRSFQVPQLVAELSVARNVELGLIGQEPVGLVGSLLRTPSYRRTAVAHRAEVAAACEAIGIGPSLQEAKVGELSLGLQRLVEIARAAVSQPRLICLDEPAAGLSDDDLPLVAAALRRLAAAGMAVLLIEHNLQFVAEVADVTFTMDQGALASRQESEGPVEGVGAARQRAAVSVGGRSPDRLAAAPAATLATEPGTNGAASDSPTLVVRGLNASYGKALALRDVDLHVAAREVVGVVGANGAGKSTLLRSIARIHAGVRGEILLNGQPIVALRPEIVAERGVTLVREGARVFEDLSVLQHVELAQGLAAARGRGSASLDPVWELFPHLSERRDLQGGYLSGGQRQMLALAMAMVSQPTCLLLDEPSAGLAESVVASVFEQIRGIADQGTTLLIAEQDPSLLQGLADRIEVLESGRVVSGVA